MSPLKASNIKAFQNLVTKVTKIFKVMNF